MTFGWTFPHCPFALLDIPIAELNMTPGTVACSILRQSLANILISPVERRQTYT